MTPRQCHSIVLVMALVFLACGDSQGGTTEPSAPPAISLAGEWSGTVGNDETEERIEATILHPSPHGTDPSSISGLVSIFYEGFPFPLSMEGTFTPPQTVTMTLTIVINGSPYNTRMIGRLEGDRITGTYDEDDGSTGTFTLSR